MTEDELRILKLAYNTPDAPDLKLSPEDNEIFNSLIDRGFINVVGDEYGTIILLSREAEGVLDEAGLP